MRILAGLERRIVIAWLCDWTREKSLRAGVHARGAANVGPLIDQQLRLDTCGSYCQQSLSGTVRCYKCHRAIHNNTANKPSVTVKHRNYSAIAGEIGQRTHKPSLNFDHS